MRKEPIQANEVGASKGQTVYPEPFAQIVAGRTKRKLGDVFGLTNFGVNLTHLEPGAASALYHWHSVQDEFVFVIEGTATVLIGDEEHQLLAGDCIGFKAGTGIGHQVVNRSDKSVTYLEVGDRLPGDDGGYPRDDLVFEFRPDGSISFAHKDGTPFR
jgi:uncharacterized cupin superfamily protein